MRDALYLVNGEAHGAGLYDFYLFKTFFQRFFKLLYSTSMLYMVPPKQRLWRRLATGLYLASPLFRCFRRRCLNSQIWSVKLHPLQTDDGTPKL